MPNAVTSMLLTCPDCLRGMSIELVDKDPPELLETQCPSCMTIVRYECWLSLAGILAKPCGVAHAVSVPPIESAHPFPEEANSYSVRKASPYGYIVTRSA